MVSRSDLFLSVYVVDPIETVSFDRGSSTSEPREYLHLLSVTEVRVLNGFVRILCVSVDEGDGDPRPWKLDRQP